MLGRMLRLAYEHSKLLRLPMIRKLKEAAPAAGLLRARAVRGGARRTCPRISRSP